MRIFFLFLSCILLSGLWAQVPPAAFHYSAVARDAQGTPLSDQQISIQVLIRSGTYMGPIEFEEIHDATTDAFGLFTLMIGAGMNQSGDLNLIEWAADHYFLQIGIDPDGGQQFTLSNATQLLSVPYALHSKTAESVLAPEYQTLSISNDTLFLTNGGFAKLPPSVLTPSALIQPDISDMTISMIGSNSAHFLFNADNVKDYEVSSSTILYSVNPNIFVQSNALSNLSKKAGEQEFFNLPVQMPTYHQFHQFGFFLAGTSYYTWPRINTINGISFFGERETFATAPVGHQGPAGGIVFFDKGFYSDGWRYMEITPTTPDTLLPWGCQGTVITGIADTLGWGLPNTAMIVQQCNDPQTAARFCQEFAFGGYQDWFLPTPTEMNLAVGNLSPLGIGGFENIAQFWVCNQSGSNSGVVVQVPDSQFPTSSSKSNLLKVRPVRRY